MDAQALLIYTCQNATLLEITYRCSYINMNPDQLFLSDQAELKLHYFQKSLNNIKWLIAITLIGSNAISHYYVVFGMLFDCFCNAGACVLYERVNVL